MSGQGVRIAKRARCAAVVSCGAPCVRTALALLALAACAEAATPDEDVALWSEAIELHPDDPDAWAARAHALTASGQFSSAVHDATKALELDPRHVDAFLARATARMEMELYERAIADCTGAIAVDPQSADAYELRGWAHAASDSLASAIEDFEMALQLEEGNPDVLNALATVRKVLELSSEGGKDTWKRDMKRAAERAAYDELRAEIALGRRPIMARVRFGAAIPAGTVSGVPGLASFSSRDAGAVYETASSGGLGVSFLRGQTLLEAGFDITEEMYLTESAAGLAGFLPSDEAHLQVVTVDCTVATTNAPGSRVNPYGGLALTWSLASVWTKDSEGDSGSQSEMAVDIVGGVDFFLAREMQLRISASYTLAHTSDAVPGTLALQIGLLAFQQ